MTDITDNSGNRLTPEPDEDVERLPPHISLDEVEDFAFRPYQMPPVIDDRSPAIGGSLDDLIRESEPGRPGDSGFPEATEAYLRRSDEAYHESLDALCRREIQLTWRSIREGGEPRTILHALVLSDYLSVAYLAAVLTDDIPEIELRAKALVDKRIIGETTDEVGEVVYFLPGLTT